MSVFSLQAQAPSAKWTMGRRGGQAAFGCYLSGSSYSSHFDVSATPPAGEKLPPRQPPTPQHDNSDNSKSNPISKSDMIRRNPEKQILLGQKFEGGEQRILWANTRLKRKLRIALQALQMCRYSWVFFLSPHGRSAHPALDPPAAALRDLCFQGGRGLSHSAH